MIRYITEQVQTTEQL